MMQLSRGQRIKLSDLISQSMPLRVEIMLSHSVPLAVDIACFGLDSDKKLSDDRYMVFYNQPQTPCGAIKLLRPGVFSLALEQLPLSIDSLVFTAAIDGTQTINVLSESSITLFHEQTALGVYRFSGHEFSDEKAMMLVELYRKEGNWRVHAVGQGFKEGLAALVTHFGGALADAAAPKVSSTQPQATAPVVSSTGPSVAKTSVSIEKRVEREAPQLVSLVKKAGVSLQKLGLQDHRARVALCLDISVSMTRLYASGQIAAFVDRIMALACRFDDDGMLDVFLFGHSVHQPEPMSLSEHQGYVERLIHRYPLETGTYYGLAMQAIRKHYFPLRKEYETEPVADDVPVYVMFVTDGQTMDQDLTERQLRVASLEPIFWQFMGIGRSTKSKKKGFFASLFETNFEFLERMDTLQGRYIDNANFFSVETPDEHDDEALYGLLLSEYKDWLPLAKTKHLLR